MPRGSDDHMADLKGGDFQMGSNQHYREERPEHIAFVKPFRMDREAVTNAQFSQFVTATGYVTTAEIPLDPATDPTMPASYFKAGSLVFQMTDGPVDLGDFRQWWKFTPGACWRKPEGPDSNVDSRQEHPVVHISLSDALSYAKWAGKELPSERQWEFAARAGCDHEFPWGRSLNEGGKNHANIWSGEFPYQNNQGRTAPLTQPVNSFEPNAYGLYNMVGNVWEWTTDIFENAHSSTQKCCTPQHDVKSGQIYVVKGGSFLCAPSYCRRYRASARSPQEARSSTSNLGFRSVDRK